jgi:hypothetical protein
MEEKKRVYITIGEYSYDVTDYKHPGGNVISYMYGQDATNAFEEFHYRSKTAKRILQSLPRTKNDISISINDTEQQMLQDFARFRKSLEDRGFFAPSYLHITYRILELFAIYIFAVYTMRYSIAVSVVVLGLFGGRCGWVQHEGGHNSLTGNIKTDKMIQNIFIGFGLLTDGSMWNGMHNRHHAATQKIGYDMDLDTAPLVLFYPNKNFEQLNELSSNTVTDKIVKYWLKYQVYTFLPITSGIIVMLFWTLYLHPRKIIRDKNTTQALFVSAGHLSRIAMFMYIGNATFYGALWYHFLTLWVSGIYLFGHFSLSHSFMPTVDSDETPNWVRYSLDHTVDIEPQNRAVSWVMGHLNNQVVHHLFPSMPQYRGPEVSNELIGFCKKWDLKYNIITYREAWDNMFANLRKVGMEMHSI